MASMMAIGILADRRDIYADNRRLFHSTARATGAIDHVVWKLYPGGLGQTRKAAVTRAQHAQCRLA